MSVQNRNQDPKLCDYLQEPKRIRFTTFFFSNGHQLGDPRKKRSHKVLFRFTFSPPTSKKWIRMKSVCLGCISMMIITFLVSFIPRNFQQRLYSHQGSDYRSTLTCYHLRIFFLEGQVRYTYFTDVAAGPLRVGCKILKRNMRFSLPRYEGFSGPTHLNKTKLLPVSKLRPPLSFRCCHC